MGIVEELMEIWLNEVCDRCFRSEIKFWCKDLVVIT